MTPDGTKAEDRPTPAPGPKRRLRIYAVVPAMIPSVIISIVNPLRLLEARGEIEFSVHGSNAWSDQNMRDADIVVFCRSNGALDLGALICAERYGKPVVYDIDDDFFTIPLEFIVGRRMRLGLALPIVRHFARTADVVRTYSPALHGRLTALGARATVFDSYFDPEIVAPAPSAGDDGIVRIVFASARDAIGSSHGAAMAALRRLSETLENVEIHLWRTPDPTLAGCRGVHVHRPTSDYAAFLRQMTALHPSIGIAPADDTPFFAGKTNNKFREYGGLGIAGVYSDVRLYRGSVTHGSTGLLVANSSAAWFEALHRLATDRDYRAGIADRARREVAQRYSVDAFLDGWRMCFARALAHRDQCEARGPRPWRLLLPAHSALAAVAPGERFYASIYEDLAKAAAPEAEIATGQTGPNPIRMPTLIAVADSSPDNVVAAAASFLAVDLCLCRNRALEAKWARFLTQFPSGGILIMRPDQREAMTAALATVRGAIRMSIVVMDEPCAVDSHFDLDGNAARQWDVVERCRAAPTAPASAAASRMPTPLRTPFAPVVGAARRLRDRAANRVRSALGFSSRVRSVLVARSAEPAAALIIFSAPDRRHGQDDNLAAGIAKLASDPGLEIMDDWTFMTALALRPAKAIIVMSRGRVPLALALAVGAQQVPRYWICSGPRSASDDERLDDLAARQVVIARIDPADRLSTLRQTIAAALGGLPPEPRGRQGLGPVARTLGMAKVGFALLRNQFDRWRLGGGNHRRRRGGAGSKK